MAQSSTTTAPPAGLVPWLDAAWEELTPWQGSCMQLVGLWRERQEGGAQLLKAAVWCDGGDGAGCCADHDVFGFEEYEAAKPALVERLHAWTATLSGEQIRLLGELVDAQPWVDRAPVTSADDLIRLAASLLAEPRS